MDGGEYYSAQQPIAAAKIEPLPCPKPLPNLRKKENKKRRRFSDEQIRSLESKFKSKTKLEPRKKLQLARELGLQPQQVWFQNRRARRRSKQIEQEYRVLKANYDNQHSQFESLKIEKQSLLVQLEKLSDLAGKPDDQGKRCKDLKENISYGGSDSKYTRHEPEILNMGGQVDGSLALPEKWCNLDSIGLFDQSCGSSNWWNFWS